MSKKGFLAILLTMLLTLSLAGCGSKQASGGGEQKAEPGKKYTLKLGHVANTEQPYHLAAVKFAELVKEKTNGNVEVQVFPNSQLGGQRDLLEGLQLGTIDIVLTSSAVLANFIPTAQVIDMPFIFRDKEHVYKVVDGDLAKEIYKGDEAKGMKIIGTWENGFRHITNNVRPIVNPDDMKGVKIRVMENQMYIDMFKSLGGNPTPMAMGEVFTALQQKTVDAQENPLGQIFASKFYEVQKYLTLDGHTYSPESVAFSKKTWDGLPKEYQDAIQQASNEARDYNRQLTAEKDKEFLAKMKEKGIQVTELTEAQKAAFQEKMKPVWEKYYDVVGKDLVTKIQETK